MEESWCDEGRRGYGAAELSDGLRKIERIVLSIGIDARVVLHNIITWVLKGYRASFTRSSHSF